MDKKQIYESVMRQVSKEVKKALNEDLIIDEENEDEDDGWGEMEEVTEVLDDCYSLQYEIKNCQKGCYTGCVTRDELADYIRELAGRLADAADTL